MDEPTLEHLRHDAQVSQAVADHAMLPRLRDVELRKLSKLKIRIARKEAE